MRRGLLLVVVLGVAGVLPAQTTTTEDAGAVERQAEIRELRSELATISARLGRLEAAERSSASPERPAAAAAGTAVEARPAGEGTPVATALAVPGPLPGPVATTATTGGEGARGVVLAPEDRATLDFFRGTTLNFAVDGYYEYNFNHPIGRVNLLRAYDVSSNSFSLNQADVIVEHLPTTQERFGGRIDLQFGQATETLQGSSANEQRPQVWRNLYQAYGSYLAPVGHGLQVDFGKWASSLGAEGNYTKDQMNYTRSYLFLFLPFYHTGFRVNYPVSPTLSVGYWLVNGAQQTEDFNGFKSQDFTATWKPGRLAWTGNYYFGQEQRDVEPTLYPGTPTGPVQPGLPTTNISPAPNGREHIFNTEATWSATKSLTLGGEADYVIDRVEQRSSPVHVWDGAAYVQYQLPRSWSLAGRTEYLSDRGGLFSGKTQALKEFTFTAKHEMAPGFDTYLEYRRDFSNQQFFLTDRANVLSKSQTTATLGLVYWWGMKKGSW